MANTIRRLDYPDVSANSAVMATLGGGHPEKHKMAGASSAMKVVRKFANVFLASSACGNMRVIKSGEDTATLDRPAKTTMARSVD